MGLTFIKSLEASGSASLEFVDGTSDVVLDNTYNEYQFYFVNMHPATSNVYFAFQVNADGQSGFNETITSTAFRAYVREDGLGSALGYDTGNDQAEGTAYQQILSTGTGIENDESVSGVLTLYDPSSTTYVKHFVADGNGYDHGDYTVTSHNAGYINTTSAIDEISFKFSSGNIDAGTIKMFGVS